MPLRSHSAPQGPSLWEPGRGCSAAKRLARLGELGQIVPPTPYPHSLSCTRPCFPLLTTNCDLLYYQAEGREEHWKQKFKRQTEKRKRVETLYRQALDRIQRAEELQGPEKVEGPKSTLTEEEWFDALDDFKAPEPLPGVEVTPADEAVPVVETATAGAGAAAAGGESDGFAVQEVATHQWADRIEEAIAKGQEAAALPGWEVFSEEQDPWIRVSRRDEMSPGGELVESCKTEARFHRITAAELIGYFCDQTHRREWETVVERSSIIEDLGNNTNIVYTQVVRVWPAAARDLLNCVHGRTLKPGEQSVSVTFSVDHPAVGESMTGGRVRMNAKTYLRCTTEIAASADPAAPARGDVSCRLIYMADVDPGGWAPPTIVKSVAKREFPKVIKQLGSCCVKRFAGRPVQL